MSDELTEWFETADAVIVAAREMAAEVTARGIQDLLPSPVIEAGNKLQAALDALDARDAAEDEEFVLDPEAAPYFDDSMPESWSEAQADEFEAYNDEQPYGD